MSSERKIAAIHDAVPTIEGAGVRLKRVFGFNQIPDFDPFLLLDDFHSRKPEDYIAGFPWHPHRGIETVTYVIDGSVEHGDSMGNTGTIRSGDCQWMTAGSGIIHQEMPKGRDGFIWGFQLWVSLPASHKMMTPRYREISNETIPELTSRAGVKVKVISGKYKSISGPVQDIVCAPEYLDVQMPSGSKFGHTIEPGHTAFAYVINGQGFFDREKRAALKSEQLVLFTDGRTISVEALEKPLRFLLISGKPIREPIAWRGPIVMNTEEELELAFLEYRRGNFVKN